MWPFRKKSLPPPPPLEILSSQSAAVTRILSVLERRTDLADAIRQTENGVLVVHLERIGTAKGTWEIRPEGVVTQWGAWQAYDKHAEKRSKHEHSENKIVAGADMSITLPTSPLEQRQGTVVFMNAQSGEAHGFAPTSPVSPEYRSWDVPL